MAKEKRSTEALEAHTGLSARHVRYYILAAQTLGWLEEENETLTVGARGLALLNLPEESPEETEFIAACIRLSPVILDVAGDYFTEKHISTAALAQRLTENSDLSPSTARRRASCLIGWRTKLLARGWSAEKDIPTNEAIVPCPEEEPPMSRSDPLTLGSDPVLAFSSLSRDHLSIRARGVLARLQVETLEDVGHHLRWEKLVSVRNCGRTTIEELMRWRDTLLAEHEGHSLSVSPAISTIEDMPLELFLEVASLPLSTRPQRFLEAHGIRWVGDLVKRSTKTLVDAKGCGKKSAEEIQTLMEALGLSLGMKIPLWADLLPAEAAHARKEELEELEVRIQRDLLGIDSTRSVEVEVRSALAAVALDEQKIAIVEEWCGLKASHLPTLEEVGRQFGVTRERVRQIVEKAQNRLATRGIRARKLEAAIRALESLGAVSSSTAVSSLQEARFFDSLVTPTSLLRLAEFFAIDTEVEVGCFGEVEFVGLAADFEVGAEVLQYARSTIRSFGCTTIEDVVITASRSGDVDSDFAMGVLESQPGFRWLERESGWFWLIDVAQNRLLNRLDKILATSPEVDLSSMRAGISRFRGMEGVCPPRRILRAVCEQLPDCEMRGDLVVDTRPRLRHAELSNTELKLLALLEEHGPVLSYAKARRLCEGAGMNASTANIALSGSAVVRRVRPGVYIKLGASASPGEIDAATREVVRGRQQRVHQDHGLSEGGSCIWLTYRISGGLLRSGAASIPVAVQPFLGEQVVALQGVLGKTFGELRIGGQSMKGLERYFRIRGVEIGDYLRVTVDLKAKVAKVEVSEDAFEEDGETPLLALLAAH